MNLVVCELQLNKTLYMKKSSPPHKKKQLKYKTGHLHLKKKKKNEKDG